ncbi:ABC transporter ATP-binding protein [Saccharibacillus alkalitolerans]|uniref:ABC transporter ATP-binding protein n=1 Tax=Saccharibacillus alkalitolerans TaxID=2705290 RepID=A0ABX0F9N5_9BACL|nr:ABC transporter ATP-binding protein [Saccharibacillus alkalitolerans]NGZ74727.1 ABC transporter ATP-binding protein [Saccharibacillus alkalitolerans]
MLKLAVYLKPYRKEVILGPLFKLLEAVLELLLPTIVALIVNHGIGERDSGYVYRMGGLMVLMALLGFGASMICQYYAARASQGFGTLLRNKLFRHIGKLSYAEVDSFGTPSLINRLTNDVNQLQLAVAMLIRLVIRAPFICIGAIIMSLFLDWRLALILLAATPVFGVTLYFIIAKSSPLYRSYQRKLDRLGKVLSENLTGLRVIRAFAESRREQRRFREASEDLTETAVRVGRISALLSPVTTLVVNAAIIAVLWAGGIRIDYGNLSQGEIIAFINYVTQILLALVVVSNLVIIFTKASSSAARVSELLAAEPSIRSAGEAAAPAPASPGTAAEAAKSDDPAIVFDGVSFAYSATGEPALQNISVAVRRGETVGVIGSTGSGKTTFANLIPRFYEVSEGSVRVDGRDVKDYALEELRRKIGIVPQKALLFSGTIAENIAFGRPDATTEEIAAAAEAAQASEFIAKLPEGLDTRVARGGQNLSGGQKQRLTIARALALHPEILILDDSSSALDFATDAALRRALRAYSRDLTVLMISQRVSTVRQSDRIIVMDDGRIVGTGSHEELLRDCAVYRDICDSQLSGEEARR